MSDPLKMDTARKAARKGPNPGQGIPNARIAGLQAEASMAHFADTKGPVAPRDELYPGTKRFTKIQQAATGQEEEA